MKRRENRGVGPTSYHVGHSIQQVKAEPGTGLLMLGVPECYPGATAIAESHCANLWKKRLKAGEGVEIGVNAKEAHHLLAVSGHM